MSYILVLVLFLMCVQVCLRLKYVSFGNERLLPRSHTIVRQGGCVEEVLHAVPIERFGEALHLRDRNMEVCIISDANTHPAYFVLNRLKCAYHKIPYGNSAAFAHAFNGKK